MKRLMLLGALIAPLLGVMLPGTASANMCSPANGPLGFLWPAIQSCQLPVPQMGGIPRVLAPESPATVPYLPQVPQVVPLPPIPPGVLP